MLVATHTISLADDLPVTQIPAEKHWTANYCFIGYDFTTNVGIYLHVGRWLQDQTIWRECVYIYLALVERSSTMNAENPARSGR